MSHNYNIPKGYADRVTQAIEMAVALRESVHKLIIEGLAESFDKGSNNRLNYLLDHLNGVSGSFRVQSVVYYLNTVAGLKCDFSEKTERYNVSRIKSDELGFKDSFTFDKLHMADCKKSANRFWKVTPAEKPLKLCDETKVFNGAVIQLARKMSMGEISVEQVSTLVAELNAEILRQSTDKKVLEWCGKYEGEQQEKQLIAESKLIKVLETVTE